jgi:hypothetical protein
MLHRLDDLLSRPVFRLGVWFVLSVLTLLIFLYPAHLINQSHPVESMYVFHNLPLFGFLFVVWFAVLLVLALSRGIEKTRNLENIVLVAIFTLVFTGIWVSLRGSQAVEASRDASNIAYLDQFGHTVHSLGGNTYRGDFPGAAIVGSAISQITAIGDFDVLTILLILQIILFPVMLYLIFKNIIKDSRWAILGVLLAIAGSIMVDKQLFQFHPASFAPFLLFTPFLFLLTREHSWNFGAVPSILLFIILMAAATVTHFVTSSFIFLVFLGVYITQRFHRKTFVTITIMCLCLVFLLVWETYNATGNFIGISNLIPKMIDDFRQGLFISGFTTGLADSYTTGANPLWANLSRYFWLALLFAFAAVLGFRNLIRIKKLDENETRVTGGILAVGFLLVITLMSSGGQEIERVLYYGAFFTVPLVVLFFYKQRERFRKYSLIALAAALAVLIFPTFLAHNNTVGTTAYYSFESDAYQWVSEQYANKIHFFYGGGAAQDDYYFRQPVAVSVNISLMYVKNQTIEGLLAERLNRINNLEEEGQWFDSVYIFDDGKDPVQFEHLLGFSPTNSPQWQEFLQRLNQHDIMYDNGYIQVYKFEKAKV